MQPYPIYINLFGTGIRYRMCELPFEVYEKMEEVRARKNYAWEQLLFDLDFLAYFGYTHWNDLAIGPEHMGFLINAHNRIEIKQGHRFLSRFNAQELTGGDTLFPLYETIQKELHLPVNPTSKTFVLLHLEKGLIAKYQIKTPHFDINELTYEVHTLLNFHFLGHIYYKNLILFSQKEDTLINSFLVLGL